MFQGFVVVADAQQGHAQQIVQLVVVAVVIESSAEDFNCLAHPVVIVVLFAPLQQLSEIAHLDGNRTFLGDVGQAVDFSLKLFWLRYLPRRFTHNLYLL